MQGVVIVVLGIALMYLVLAGKLDCLIAAFRACAGNTSEVPTSAVTSVNAKNVMNKVLSPNDGLIYTPQQNG